MTFYLKYRSKNINELDLTSVRESLEKIVRSKKIPHALLFAGPKGTGKTSAARILAKILNCVSKNPPCGKCEQCMSISKGTNMDVVEMDAASNRGIDDIRVLRDVVKLSAAHAKNKVYIIDEAHMLTTEASNALLKTLEEPPQHVYFVMATTNPEKLIPTIRSRTMLIRFNKATREEILRSVKRVVRGEKIKISDSNLETIVKASNGSFRDAAKLLERVVSEGVGFLKNEAINTGILLEVIQEKNLQKVLTEVERNVQNGVSASMIVEELLNILRGDLLATQGIGKQTTHLKKDELLYLIELLIGAMEVIKISPIEELPLELVFYKWFTKFDGQNHLEKNS